MGFDKPTDAIASFASSVSSGGLSDENIHSAIRTHFDSIACALGGFHGEPCEKVRRYARTSPSSPGCSVLGIRETIAPEQAAFANGSMIRLLDYNDAFSNIGGGHPSDMVAAIFTAAEFANGSGADLARAIYVAYEVFTAMAVTYPTASTGWDQGVSLVVGSAAGCAVALGLDYEGIGNAIGMALVPSLPMRCTRSGELSNWKGLAGPHAGVEGLTGARLAQFDLTGPSSPFEGSDGLNHHIPPVGDLPVGQSSNGESGLDRTNMKYFAANGNVQSIIGPVIDARGQINNDDIVKITVDTYTRAKQVIGGGYGDKAEKWHPKTRETADHSMPFTIAVALLDGEVTFDSFSPERIADPRVHELTDMTTIEERSDLTARWPAEQATEVQVTLRDGKEVLIKSGDPVGHPNNPATDEQLSHKFHQMSKGVLSHEEALKLEAALWSLGQAKDLGELTALYRAIPE